MSCLINIVGIPLAIGLMGYGIFYFIRTNIEARALRRAQVQAKIDQARADVGTLKDPWKNNPQDSKFFDGGK